MYDDIECKLNIDCKQRAEELFKKKFYNSLEEKTTEGLNVVFVFEFYVSKVIIKPSISLIC